MKIQAVIGAAFGDEGKGRTVNFLSEGKSTLVVKHNGGAQAGHTVSLEKGRHVFSHFGSGTLQGSPTYLSRQFIVNPLLAFNEKVELDSKNTLPITLIDTQARLSTPYDMLLNQYIERWRATKEGQHGSVGVGIHETTRRPQDLQIHFGDPIEEVGATLSRIREYAIERLGGLEIAVPEEMRDPRIGAEFLDKLEWLNTYAIPANAKILQVFDHIIFESGQGLLLDGVESNPFFPHVTCSRTGIHTINEVLRDSRLGDWIHVDIYYCLRTYMTRHGAGPFPTEDKEMRFPDQTNQPNEWQGAMRFGKLDIPRIRMALLNDMKYHRNTTCYLSMGHFDQYDADYIAIADQLGLNCGLEFTDEHTCYQHNH